MGVSLSTNAASMVADVYSSSTSTTTITDVNSNAASQSIVFDNCTIPAALVNITQGVSQVQSIQQTASVQNSQISTTSINQSLLQQAQSSVSSWGIGVASASNSMNVATSVSTSVKNAVDESFSNLNSTAQTILCTNSTIGAAGGTVNIGQSVDQDITATQVSSSTNLQSVSTAVSQSATQTATATVSGLDFTGMIVAVIVLVVVVGIVGAIAKAKYSKTVSRATAGLVKLGGGGLVKLSPTEVKLFVASAILIVILAVLGAVGLQQRAAHACDFTGQCTPTTSQFWFSTAGATCSLSDRYTVLGGTGSSAAAAQLLAPAALPTLVAPPLFMCNAVRALTPLGTAATPQLYPGVLQQLVVAKKVNNSSTSTTDTSTPQRNNSGYNVGVFAELLRMSAGAADVDGADPATKYIAALVTWFQRQMATVGSDGKPLVATPDGADASAWCAARVLRDLLPIQPVLTAPQAGLSCTKAVSKAAAIVSPCPPTGTVSTECSASTGTDTCGYLVRLPGSFVASSPAMAASVTATSYVTYLCLPNAFVPDLTTGATASVFLGNDTASADFPSARTCYYSTTDFSATPSGTGANQQVYLATCVQATSTTNPLVPGPPNMDTDYACGCLTLDDGEACWADGTAVYNENDNLCFVNSSVTSSTSGGITTYTRRGGFILRRVDTFAPSIYNIASAPASELYNYAATPSSDRLQAWVNANSTAGQQARLFMFLRIYYWLLLTINTANRTLSELGLSTFVNDAGYDDVARVPNISFDSPDLSTVAMYAVQPLLVKYGNAFAFYTLQEMMELETLPATDRAAYLAQVSMWCYSADALGVGTAVASSGFNVSVNSAAASTASDQIVQAGTQRGLLVGRFGFCKMWFTDDVYVASTLGVAGSLLLLLLVYAIAVNVVRK